MRILPTLFAILFIGHFHNPAVAGERELFAQVYGADEGARPSHDGFELRATKVDEKGVDIQGKARLVDWPKSGEIRVVPGPAAKVHVTKAKQGGWVYGKTQWELNFSAKDLQSRSKQVYEFRAMTHEISADGLSRELRSKNFLFIIERIQTGVSVSLLKKDESAQGSGGDGAVAAYSLMGKTVIDENTPEADRAKKIGDDKLSVQIDSIGKDRDTLGLKFYYSGGFVPDKQVGWEDEKDIKKLSATYRQDDEEIKIEPMDLQTSQSFRILVSVYGGVYEE